MRAADALMESLKAEGVEHIFGIPGGANLPTYDALVDAEFRHIQVRHEQGGGHAAEGYAKASGRVGVAFATSGPADTTTPSWVKTTAAQSGGDVRHHPRDGWFLQPTARRDTRGFGRRRGRRRAAQ